MQTLRSQRGATFIEIMAAVTVFAVVVSGLSPALLSVRKFADLSTNQSIATALAEDKLEQIRTLSSVSNGNDGPLKADGTSGGIFSRSWTVTSNTPRIGVNEASVAVSWQDRQGTNTITLVTLFQ